MTLIQFIEALAILVSAFSGFVEARSKKMDVVGVFIVAFITAFGGGTLRDILLDQRPLFWVTHQEYAILVFMLALIASPLIRTLRRIVSERLIIIAGALGLGLFSTAGVSQALAAGMPYAACSFVGCWMYLLMKASGIPADFALWSSALAIFVLRMVTWTKDIRLR